MSRPAINEPPAKRKRAHEESKDNLAGSGGFEEDQEFRRLEAVSAVQDELNALLDEEALQVLQVHKAFLKRKRPLFAKRQDAIAQVPDFWLKVLLAHPLTQPYIADGDQLALSYLESVSVHTGSPAFEAADGDKGRQAGTVADDTERNGKRKEGRAGGGELDDDDDGFRVTFTFRENPFFSNKELWREWEPAEGQAAYSTVEWKDTDESRDLQASLLWNLDPAAEQEETPSFFSIFCDDMEEDYELGEALRGDITDNPLEIYMRHDFDAEALQVDEEEEEEEQEEQDWEEGGDLRKEDARHDGAE